MASKRATAKAPGPAPAPPPVTGEPRELRDRLRDDILGCELAPGLRLKFGEMKARYSASVGTLREALTELVVNRLVLAETNRGFTVAPVSIADLLDITELRVDLENKALTLSIQNGDDEWEARVLTAFHLLKKTPPPTAGDPDGVNRMWDQRHRNFHEALIASCTSPWVLHFRRTLFDQARRYRALSMKHSTSPGRMDQHKRLMESVLNRDIPTATSLAEAHIRDTARTVLGSIPGYKSQMASAPRRRVEKAR